MATKRKPIHTQMGAQQRPNMNFRPGINDTTARAEAKGTRPTATPTSVKEVLTMMVLHVCKKIIFFDTNLKVPLYLGSLFFVSLIGDFLPYPKTYLAKSDNLFNVYFIKMGWGWTLLFSLPFLAMTSLTVCCGDIQKLVKNHLPRLGIATGFWFFWTKFFNIIESSYGRCSIRGFESKSACLKAGHLWNGFDISGHAFILIYSSLVLMEEARSIIGWESIKEHLRNEEHNRTKQDSAQTTNPLKSLKDVDLKALKHLYTRYTPTIRLLFVGMTMLQLLWDVMLVGTMLYYHRMVEKVLSGIIAVLTWFVTYRAWYPATSLLPDPVGKGMFNYQSAARPGEIGLRRRTSLLQPNTSPTQDIPKFMGMPLYTSRQQHQQNTAAPAAGLGSPTDAGLGGLPSSYVSSLNAGRLGAAFSGGSNFDVNSPSISRFQQSSPRSKFD